MILPVPEIKKVSKATCEYFNRIYPGDQEGSSLHEHNETMCRVCCDSVIYATLLDQ